ncbi:hypothetical protein [Kitasatospora sp. LaBMicrA B282]|uniref:hypothetical protein n=1 Tax=Kitasatospora sp. LaBMicrA B282 TaxID=3420949 RepID=UPI003D113412
MTGSGRPAEQVATRAAGPDVTVVLTGPPPGAEPPPADWAAALEALAGQSIRRRRSAALAVVPAGVVPAGRSGSAAAPAGPLLDTAVRGRYVCFLGPGERLAESALEELVALADRAGADVVFGCPAAVPGAAPWAADSPYQESLFAYSWDWVDFSHPGLAPSLGQARLFRRTALAEYGLLEAGPGLPLALEVCLRSRRIAVLGGTDCLYPAAPELPVRPGHEQRLRELTAALAVVARLAAPGAEAAVLRGWAFGWELPQLLRPDFLTLEVPAQRRVCAGVGRLLDRYCPPAEYQLLPARERLRLDLARRGRAGALRRLIRYQAAYGAPAMYRVPGELRPTARPAPARTAVADPSLVVQVWRGVVPARVRRRLRRRPAWRQLVDRAYARWGEARPVGAGG